MIGNSIRHFREKKSLRQEDLAELLNVTTQTLLKWESDKTEPKVSQLFKLSEALGVSIGALCENKEHDLDEETKMKIRETATLSDDEKKCLNMFIEAMLLRHYSKSIQNKLTS